MARILSVIDTFEHGGAETVLTELILGMPGHQHALLHFSRTFNAPPDRWLVSRLEAAGVPIFEMEYAAISDPAVHDRLPGGFKPDVVIYHWWKGDPLAAWRSRARTHPDGPLFLCVMHSAANPDTLIDKEPYQLERCEYDHYVSVCKFVANHFSRIPTPLRSVIYNGVHVERFSTPATSGRDPRFVIGRVSNLKASKIPRHWIAAASRFPLQNPLHVIAGDGACREELMADAEGLGVARLFEFPGYVSQSDLPRLLSRFDIYCYITNNFFGEAHSLALLEAMAAGLPIVSHPRGGIPEQVVHGVTGFLSEDLTEVGEFCGRLEKDKELRRRMSEQARRRAGEFTVERMCGEYRALIDRLLDKREKNKSRVPV